MIDHDGAEQVLQTEGHLYLEDGTDAGPVRRIFLDEYSGWPGFCTIRPRPSLSPVSGPAGRCTASLMCRVALDRGIRLICCGLLDPAHTQSWTLVRDQIRNEIEREG